MANLLATLYHHTQNHPFHILVLLLITLLLTISSPVGAANSNSSPLNNFFACQQRQNKAITECSASSFGGLDTASKQLTSVECCNLSRYTNCVIGRAVTGECKESLANVKEQMLAALKQNCPNLSCSAATSASISSLLLMITLLTTSAFTSLMMSST